MAQPTSAPCCAVTRRLGPDAVARVDAALAAMGQPGATKLAQIAAWPEVAAVGLSQPTLSKHRKHLPGGVESHERTRGTAKESSPLHGVVTPPDDPKTTPRKVITAELEERCVQLRVAGKTYAQIGVEVGIDDETAIDAVERVLVRTIGRADRKAENARELELRRCEALIDAHWAEATGQKAEGQARAAGVVLRASERKARLLGLDAQADKAGQVPFYLAPGFDDFLGKLLGPLVEAFPEAAEFAFANVEEQIAMLAVQRPVRSGLRLISGGRS